MTRIICLILSVFLVSLNPLVCFAQTVQAAIEKGTTVRLKLGEALSAKIASVGQKLQLTAAEDVFGKDGKTVVIKGGAPAVGYLINVDDKSCASGGKSSIDAGSVKLLTICHHTDMSLGNKLSIEVSSIKAIDDSRIPLRAMKPKDGAGSYVIGGFCFAGVGLVLGALFGQSKHAQIPEGTIITAFVERDSTIAIASGATEQTVNKPVGVTTVSGNVVNTDKPESKAAGSPKSIQNTDGSATRTKAEKTSNAKTM